MLKFKKFLKKLTNFYICKTPKSKYFIRVCLCSDKIPADRFGVCKKCYNCKHWGFAEEQLECAGFRKKSTFEKIFFR
jgi:hypothetical protein